MTRSKWTVAGLAMAAAILIIIVATLSGVMDTKGEKAGFRRDYASVPDALKAVPPSMTADFNMLRTCLGDEAAAAGRRVPELTVARIADVADQLKADPQAAQKCVARREARQTTNS